ncbi:lasso RiPP family leader peptide-containing protein [Dyadobacter sp. CY261]|uniref:lasso RiPP family leader peptide-containing protein n=1 Tax=Dyadobacter sp. CY261 TaxID=2907203 RepID=UPI0038D3F05E
MRTVITHSTQTRKSYRKPVLNKLGNVAKLTKGKFGGSFDIKDGQKTFNPD